MKAKTTTIEKIIFSLLMTITLILQITAGDIYAALKDDEIVSSRASGDILVDLKWINAPSGQDQNMTWSDPSNLSNDIQIPKYSLNIHTENTAYDTGKLTVRIKRSLWTDRNGKPITPDSIGIPKAPTAGTDVPFNYVIDENTDEIIITNTAPVPSSSTYSIQVQYKVTPWDTKSGSTGSFSAKVVGEDTNGNSNTIVSEPITYKVITEVKSNDVKKQDPKPMYYWDPTYTGGKPKPEDFDQYRWVSWRIDMGGKSNQPYKVKLTENPGQGGQVYLISDGDVTNHILSGSDYSIQDDGVTIISKDYTKYGEIGPANGDNNSIRVLVKYPKNETTTLTNTIEETVTGLDDSIPHSSSGTGTIEWKDYKFEYKGVESIMKKYTDLGGPTIDLKEYWSKFAVLKAGADLNVTWGMFVSVDLYPGVNYTDGDTYSGEMTDDFVNWQLANTPTNSPVGEYIKMTPDDYEYTSVTLNGESYQIDRNSGQKLFYAKGDKNAPLIKVWALVEGSSNYQLVDQVYSSELSYDNGSGRQVNVSKTFNLPSGTYKVKTTYDNAVDHLGYRMDLNLKVKGDSPQIKKWVADGGDTKRLRIQNFNYYKVFNEDGTLRNKKTESDYKFTSDQGNNTSIKNDDQKLYNEYLDRSTAAVVLLDPAGQSSSSKLAATPVNDTVNHVVNMEYWLYGSDTFQGLSTDEFNQMIEAGWTPPTRDEVVLYDLLPLGMVYNENNEPIVYDINGNADTSNLTTETISNFRGTGRQLVIFKISAKQKGKNYTNTDAVSFPGKGSDGKVTMIKSYGNVLGISGYSLKFNAVVAWENVGYAQNGVNIAAYQVPEDQPLLGGGFEDNGNTDPINKVLGSDGKSVFYDLRGNGVNSVHDTLYMSVQEPINVTVSSASGFSKLVRADEDGELSNYTKQISPKIGTSYTYQLKVGTANNTTMKDIVLFDILEEAENTEGHSGETSWKGTFDSITLEYAIHSGIKPVVYYSTKTGLSYNGLDANSLNNGDWTTTEPTDKTKITAVAIDLRTAEDGSNYVLPNSTETKVLIHMKAPDVMPKGINAYNRASYQFTQIDSTGNTSSSISIGSRDTVKLYQEVTQKTVTKVWDDDDNNDGKRPDKIDVQLYANGIEYGSPVEVSEATEWKYTWNDLPKLTSANGSEVLYTVKEIEVPVVYDVAYSEDTFTITNTHIPEKTEKTVTKLWDDNDDQDGKRPESILVQLYGDGNVYGEPVTVNSLDEWEYTWKDLPKYINGREINYSAMELNVPDGYHVSYSEDTFTITNQHNREEISETVIKLWDDNNNQDGKRLDKIFVQLISDDSLYGEPVELNEENGWRYTWENLPKYDEARKINYTAVEVGDPGEYQVSYSEDTFIITNSYSSKYTSRTVVKSWEDDNDLEKKRPSQIKVQLYANDIAYGEPIELNEGNDWRYTWENIPMENREGEIIYTLKEIGNIEEYTTEYEDFIIINTHKVSSNSPTPPTTNNPPFTGDMNYSIIYLTLIIASSAIIIRQLHLKNKKLK